MMGTNMKKTIYILLFHVLYVHCLMAQTPIYNWANVTEGSFIDNDGNYIALDKTGSIYKTGFFQGTMDFDPGAGVFNLTSSGNEDIFISKLDSNGNFIWARNFGGPGNDHGISIAVGVMNNIYVTGYFEIYSDFDPGPGTFNLTSNGNFDVFILKINASGDFVWAKNMGGSASDKGISIALDSLENSYATGYFVGIADFDPSLTIFNLTSNLSSSFVLKLDSNGILVWAIPTGESTNATSFAIDSNGNSYTAGLFNSLTIDFDPGPGIFSLQNGEGVFISKFDSYGNFVWARGFSSTFALRIRSIATDVQGNIYSTGYFSGVADFDPGLPIYSLISNTDFFGNIDIFILKLDSGGNFSWARNFETHGLSHSIASSIAVDHLGDIYSTGIVNDTIDFDPGPGVYNLINTGISFCFISKLDSTGSFVWAKKIGGPGSSFGTSIVVAGPGNIYLTGGLTDTVDFNPPTGTNLTSSSSASTAIFTARFGQALVGIGEISSLPNFILYPNPTSGKIEFSLTNKIKLPALLSIYNILGEKILEVEVNSIHSQINLDAKTGIYFLRIESKGVQINQKVAIER